MAGETVLVVGGAGYIGSHTCLDLANKGYKPVVFDNFSNGHREFVKWGPAEEGDIRDRARLDRLEKLTHAQAMVLPTKHVADIWKNMCTIALIEGVAERGERAIAQRQAALNVVVARAKARGTHPTAFYMVWDKPLMTAGADSYLNDLIALAGGRNIAATATGGSYPTYSWESLLAQNPDVILGPTNMAKALQGLKTQYPSLKAVKSNRLRTLPDDLISRPGPRVAEALAAVEAALH